MKWLFFFILTIHSLIHLLGFLKAFQLAEITMLTQHISNLVGLLWLAALLLFLSSAALFITDNHLWWLTAIPGVFLSQSLIIFLWSDAKFGTTPNIIILIIALVALADWYFNREVKNEVSEMLSKNPVDKKEILTEEKISHLPPIVRRWLKTSGVLGRERIRSVYLKQKGMMRLKTEQKNWYYAQAEQWFTVDNPAFIWKVNVDMMPLVFFTGRDKFFDGKGNMLIKIQSLVKIVNDNDNEKINQSTLQRYLGETIWFPSAVVSPHIQWEEVDSLTA